MIDDDHMVRLLEEGVLTRLDYHFGCLMAKLDGSRHGSRHGFYPEDMDPDIFLAAALTSSFTRKGHICLRLDAVAGSCLLESENGHGAVCCPDLVTWRERLLKSPVVGTAKSFCPLIMDGQSRLYLKRYWDYQQHFLHGIQSRFHTDEQPLDRGLFQKGLKRLFDSAAAGAADPAGETDWQKVAAYVAIKKRLCIISGGPGTGKTTTVAKILALILEQPQMFEARIALTAPTGKATAKLQNTIRQVKNGLPCEPHIKEAIPEEAATIHRLLGVIPGSPYFRYHRENLLPVDLLVVDEASMVDLALMSKMVDALPAGARLILLGDKDQLASVEAGAVLGDLCGVDDVRSFSRTFCRQVEEVTGIKIPSTPSDTNHCAIQDCVVQLEKNYRFDAHSGIATLSHWVNEGRGDDVCSFLTGGNKTDVVWHRLPSPESRYNAMKAGVIQGFTPYLNAKSVTDALIQFERFRILAALREGPYGVHRLNRLVETILQHADLVDSDHEWYRGRPIMVTNNDYQLQLFNGDIGIAWPDDEAGHAFRVFFIGANGSLRRFHPLRLPAHETVFAMTVHKSQGSEFEHVQLVLPDQHYPVLTRELVYTGITRAKKVVEVWGDVPIVRGAVENRTERMSGLADMIRGAHATLG